MTLRRLGVLTAFALSVMTQCSGIGRPAIDSDHVKKDLIDHYVTVEASPHEHMRWIFSEDEKLLEVKVLETDFQGDAADVVIEVANVTETSVGRRGYRVRAEGRIRVHYEWIVDEWLFRDMENLSFEIVKQETFEQETAKDKVAKVCRAKATEKLGPEVRFHPLAQFHSCAGKSRNPFLSSSELSKRCNYDFLHAETVRRNGEAWDVYCQVDKEFVVRGLDIKRLW